MDRSVKCVVFVCVLCLSFSVKGATIWSDGFESGNFNSWNSAGGNWSIVTSTLAAHGGTKGADVKGNTAPDDDILTLKTSSGGFENLKWQYWFKVREGLEAVDYVVAEWTADNLNWMELAKYTDLPASDWQLASFSLPAAASENANLGFRFRANLGSTGDRMSFDDISLIGASSVPEPSLALLLNAFAFPLLRRKRA